jgi:hypothetical protein
MATLPRVDALIAMLNPAMPLPKIKKSVLNSITVSLSDYR